MHHSNSQAPRHRSILARARRVGFLFAAAILLLAVSAVRAQAQCGTLVFLEDFESGGVGWTTTGSWTIEPPPCLGTSLAPPGGAGSMAWVRPAVSVCTCSKFSDPCSGSLISAPVLLPAVAPGETLLLDFAYTSIADTLKGSGAEACNRVEVQSATQLSTFTMPTPLAWGCTSPGTPPYDITRFAGEEIWMTWKPAILDGEGKVTLLIDNVRIERYPPGLDCNGNNVPDACDIAKGTSQDCNGNAIPDECDIASGTSLDCNGNGVPDECDLAFGTSLDCNGNGTPDECDIASGLSQDCNANGIPDECDIASGTSHDHDGDGVPDECQCTQTHFYCLGGLNSIGRRAVIGYQGSTSLTENDLVLTVGDAVPGQFGLFFYGNFKTSTPFGDGTLCVTGGQTRLNPAVHLDAQGKGSRAVDFTTPPASGLAPLSQPKFQFWYRDPQPIGAGFNLSNALSLHLCP